MKVSFSKKRTVIATIVLFFMTQILWIYPTFIKNPGNSKFVILIFGISLFFLYMKIELSKIIKGIISVGMLLFLSYALFVNLQAPFPPADNILSNMYMLNVGLLFVFILLLFLFTNSTRVTGIITTVLTIVFSFLNMFIYYFRGKPIAPADIHSIKTAIGVSSNYTFWLNDFVIKDIFILLVFIIVFIQLDFRIEKNKNRFFVMSLILLISIGSLLTFYNTEKLEEKGFKLEQFLPMKGVKNNGYLLDFYLNSKGLRVNKPEGYSLKFIEELNVKVKDNIIINESIQMPNILIIMNESFCDLDALGYISYSSDPLPFFNSLKKNTIRGNLVSSVYGGNTPNSEFECLTGGTLAFFPKDTIVYQQFLHSEIPNTVTMLSNMGYYTLGMHPYNKIYWERERVYPNVLLFDEFISEDTIENPYLVRDYISDKECFDILLDRLKSKKEPKPLFNFTITMQNHGGYYFGMTDVIAPELKNPYVDEFLSLMKVTDDAFKEFIEELEMFEEPTIVCMFGDHQPRLEDSVYDTIWADEIVSEEEKEIRKHIVPFVIWANYDIKGQAIPLTSINYLSPMILELAELNMSPYYNYLLDLQKKYPSISSIGYFDTDLKLYPIRKENEGILEINEYEILQYNYIHDNKNRNIDFFTEIK